MDDPDVAIHACDGLVAMTVGKACCVGRPITQPPAPDLASLCRHDAAVVELMAACTVVPFRFGTVVTDQADLKAKLAGRADHLPYLLDRLRGRREVAFRAGLQNDRSAPTSRVEPGSSYLRRLHQLSRVPEAITTLHDRLSELVVEAVGQWDAQESLFKGSYLVEAAEVPSFAAAASRLATAHVSTASVSLTGPWAPYSFTQPPVTGPRAIAGAVRA
ncbi:MAG TPA: GvpL/GvpF family gas vesicle protein [Acidimicrobiales bacterium]|nr:GvpL/GvpF family gas vesicle protein [Acidimicrobiales bacterium]